MGAQAGAGRVAGCAGGELGRAGASGRAGVSGREGAGGRAGGS